MTSLPGAGGGHTADSDGQDSRTLNYCIEVLRDFNRANARITTAEAERLADRGIAALARLEQTIDGLRRERSSLEAAANRTAEAERRVEQMEQDDMTLAKQRVAAEAERDVAQRAYRQRHLEAVAFEDRAEAAEAERDEWKARRDELYQWQTEAIARMDEIGAERDAALAELAHMKSCWGADGVRAVNEQRAINAQVVASRDAALAALREIVAAVEPLMASKPTEIMPDGLLRYDWTDALYAIQEAIGPARAVLGGPK